MASGKKSKRTKFIPLKVEATVKPFPVARKSSNWADEVEDESDVFQSRKPQLPTASRAAFEPHVDHSTIPNEGPFVAYISNLHYDVDEHDLEDFFSKLQIKHVRLPRDDKESGRLRGFGYVEFDDRNSLIEAINISNPQLKGRRMRIEATQENERGRRGNRMDMNRDRPERSESSSAGDWRTGPRQESHTDSGPIRRGGGGGGFNNRDRDDGPRGSDDSSWRDSNNDRPSFRDNRDKDRDRGFTRRNFNDRDDNDGGSFSRGNREPQNVEQRQRRPLELQPRKQPITPLEVSAVPAESIFGAAKPVDTAAREREIEEKLAREKELKLAELDKKESETKGQAEREEVKPPVANSWRVAREDNRDLSPPRGRDSPQRRRDSPPRRRDSPPRRRESPRRSPARRRDSPPRRRYSPPRRRDSPSRRRDSPPRRRDSPPRRRDSPPRRRDSPPRRRDSPPRRRDGPPPARRNDMDRSDKRPTGGARNDVKDRNDRNDRNNRAPANAPPQRNPRMPRKNEEEPPNFAESNKFAYLEDSPAGSSED